MRKLVCFFMFVALLWAAIAFQSATPDSSYGGGTLCASASSVTSQSCVVSVTAGDFLVVAVAGGNGTTTISDTQSNAYGTALSHQADSTGTRESVIFATPSVASTGSLTITVADTSVGYMSINVLRYTGIRASGYLDVASGGFGDSSLAAMACGTLTTTNANDVLVIAYNSPEGNTGVPSAGFTLRSVQPNSSCCEASGAADQVVASTGAYSPSWTAGVTGNSACSSVALKAVATSSTKVRRRVIQ